MHRIKSTYDIVVAVEMDDKYRELALEIDPIEEPNGRLYIPLGQMRAGVVEDESTPDHEVERKAVRTACHWFKQQNPEWADSLLHGLGVELQRRSLVRD